MGYLLEGTWKDGWYDTARTGGDFVRPQAQFRGRVTADGASGYAFEPGRYHLYVSLACPWAHRTLIMRKLKGLESAIASPWSSRRCRPKAGPSATRYPIGSTGIRVCTSSTRKRSQAIPGA